MSQYPWTLISTRPELGLNRISTCWAAFTGTGLTTTSAVHTPNQSEVLATIAAIPGETLITTIDPAMQRAAEAALDASPKASTMTSALVAIEVSTGEVVAVANGPRGATVNFAMTGQYPPGSIFKIVSGYTVLRDALGPADPVDCPATVTVGGRTFSNAEDEVFGVIPFSFAFFHSCNTAFVNATLGFAPEALSLAAAETAEDGFGLTHSAENSANRLWL